MSQLEPTTSPEIRTVATLEVVLQPLAVPHLTRSGLRQYSATVHQNLAAVVDESRDSTSGAGWRAPLDCLSWTLCRVGRAGQPARLRERTGARTGRARADRSGDVVYAALRLIG